ncbi:glycosyltransferase [Acinetobacter ursingii]|uniref:glycosyltransferase n=1 Tax=Acinetobacter ursingii TaxID=108980 RepID=UPI003AF45BC3
MNKHIYVVMRLSVISKKNKRNWIAGEGTYEDYVANILNEERLNKHFELFEKVALASLVNQKDFDVENNLTLILLTAEMLPKKYKEKLEYFQNKYSWIKISYLSENCDFSDYNSLLVNEIKFLTNKTKTGTLFATVRLDDDDALSHQFLSKLYSYLDPKFIGFGYSAPRGAVGFLEKKGNQYEVFHQYDIFNVALGLSFINYFAYTTQEFHKKWISVYNLGDHSFIDKIVPVITDGSYLAYLRTRHSDSDSDSDYFTNMEKKKPLLSIELVKKNIHIAPDLFK